MKEQRPDPDALLARVQQDDADARRGKLKVFFGASAGVGKTCAMLSAAQAARAQGLDAVVGLIETHGRADTQALADGLEHLPLRDVVHRDRALKEFDLDAALARHPGLLLVDELAHTNASGSRHPKRWQDIEELLGAGIDVWTTLNVQHLDSLNDVVGGITGIRVWETVPDKVFDEADEVVIVDLPPDDLLQRLKEGKVYLPDQAEQAVRHFFRKGNLIALRELALRRTADRVDDDMLQYRQRSHTVQPVWSVRDALLACVGPGEHGEKTVRATARLAAQLNAPWHAVYVETPALQRLNDTRRQGILRALKVAQGLGATTATLAGDDAAPSLVKYARDHNLSRLVLGRDQARRHWPWRRPLADRIGALGDDLDLVTIALPAADRDSVPPNHTPETHDLPWRGHAFSAAICGGTALLAAPLTSVLDLANIVMLFLLAVVVVAVRQGRGPAVLAAFLSVGLFDFFFVTPRFSFVVRDAQYLLTFGVMLGVALLIGQLTARLTYQAKVAQRREDRMRALYEMSRDLSGALLVEQVAEIGARFLSTEFSAHSALLVADGHGQLQATPTAQPLPDPTPELDLAIAQWSFNKGEAAGHGTDTLSASPVLYLPLSAPMRLRGVLAVQARDPARLAVPEQRRLLDTCASLLAMSLERLHYIDVAQTTTVQMESERLRNALLAAVSHDLRTPLALVVGLSESLLMARPPLPEPAAETAQALSDAARRMNALVGNLLDMARLQSGNTPLNLQWQPLEEVIGSALQATRATLGARTVQVDLPEHLPFVNIDAVLIERVLVNLLENIAKYTPAGTPVDLRARVHDGHLELQIDDHGPGLPQGREALIFDKFDRGGHHESALPGVGLGLAICRAIAQAHGGGIHGLTRDGGGARFILRLPQGLPPPLPHFDPEATVHE
ncbi:MAG: two-component system sensor histidine kinase KdbD [Rubrivivax sp.]|nr:MAG: two-component system sensor histidine kinase KdbD [Rubrivivax sp.]